MSEITDKKFNILCLSGGGFRGLFTAKVLEKLEDEAGKPIGQCFDLICGTSIGGIIAMGLGLEIPAKDIATQIENEGRNIFKDKRSALMKFLCKSSCIEKVYFLKKARYSNKNLENTVKKILGENTVGDSKHRLLITSVNYTTGKPQMFKTRHHPDFKMDYKLPMIDVAMATSAAPTYFPIWKNSQSQTYLDGGIVANAPGLLGVHEARYFLEKDESTINMLSIGTMNGDARLGSTEDLNKGTAWGEKIFDVVTSAQENLTNYMLGHILKDSYAYINVQPIGNEGEIIGLDKTSAEAQDILIAHASQTAQDFIGKKISNEFLRHQPPTFIPEPKEV